MWRRPAWRSAPWACCRASSMPPIALDRVALRLWLWRAFGCVRYAAAARRWTFIFGVVRMRGWDLIRGVRVTAVVASVLLAGPGFGEVNLAGVWDMTLTEDFPDRLPGPE